MPPEGHILHPHPTVRGLLEVDGLLFDHVPDGLGRLGDVEGDVALHVGVPIVVRQEPFLEAVLGDRLACPDAGAGCLRVPRHAEVREEPLEEVAFHLGPRVPSAGLVVAVAPEGRAEHDDAALADPAEADGHATVLPSRQGRSVVRLTLQAHAGVPGVIVAGPVKGRAVTFEHFPFPALQQRQVRLEAQLAATPLLHHFEARQARDGIAVGLGGE